VLSPPSGFLCGRVVTPRCRGVKLFPIFIIFFVVGFYFFKKFRGNAQLVSALVQYNNTNVRLPEYFFVLKARLGKS